MATKDKKELKETTATQVRKESLVDPETLVSRVPSVSPVPKENQVFQAIRESTDLRGKRECLASLDAMGQMDRRVNLDGSVLPAAKETQATEVPMVIPETSVNVVSEELEETRVMPVALEDLVPLARPERLDRRESVEVLDHLANPD